MKRVILGVKIDSLTFKEAIQKIDSLICAQKPSQIVTVNPEFVMAAQKDDEFRRIINQADLAVPDGVGLMLAGRFLGQPFKERITGVDLTWAICKLAEDRGYSVFFLGGGPGVAKKAAERIKKIHSRLNIAGYYSGKPNDKKTLLTIQKAKPDILLVAFGAPKQDKFIYNLLHNVSDFELNALPSAVRASTFPCVSIGVGGTFDYIAGILPYAPDWMRKLGLEWLFRLFTQPKRLGRIYTAVIKFPLAVLLSKFKSS
jgi:N-acetylglucosaminyldiphosphoundecaprenol N-acetyl-beta-D-mannosaminyltransferase